MNFMPSPTTMPNEGLQIARSSFVSLLFGMNLATDKPERTITSRAVNATKKIVANAAL